MLGKVDVAHGLHGGIRIALRKVLCGEHHAASVDLLLQIRLEKFPRIGIKVLRADVNQIPRCSLPCHFCPLVHKAVDILPQTFPLGVGLGLRQMFDGQGVVQKEAEAEHPAVDEVVHIFAPGHKGIEGHALKKLPVQDHGAAEGKGRALEARPAADDLVKGPCLAAEAVPIGHPRLRLHIIIILPFAVEVVARHAVDNVAVDPSSQKLQRARHEVRQFKHLVIIDQQRGVRRQNGGRQQADVAHIGVTKHGQELCSLIVQPCGVQNTGYFPQVACREQVGFRIQLCSARDAEHLPVGFLLHLRRGGADQDHQLEVLFMELLHAEQGAFQRPLLIHRRGMVIDRVPLLPQLAGSAAPVGGNDHGFSHTVSLLLRVLGKHGSIDILQLCHKELLCEVLAGIPGDKRPPLRGFSAVSQFL